MPYAVIFPGQGAAEPGAGEDWQSHPSWRLIEEAEAVLQRPLARLLLEADADELATTRSSQLAVLLTSLMAWDAFSTYLRLDQDEDQRDAAGTLLPPELRPSAFAGHSLGQITALIASGAVGRPDGLRLAAERADLSQRSADANPGRMAALVGATSQTAEEACDGTEAWVANDNAPGQVVIAGTPAGLEQASERSRSLGVRRVRQLSVGHAFHTPLLADAVQGLRPLLDRTTFNQPAAPIVANTDARCHTDPAGWPDQLSRHLVEPVRWRECQQALATLGIDTFVEIGPGHVLAGLARRTVQDVRVLNVATPTTAAEVARTLSAEVTEPTEPVQVTGMAAATEAAAPASFPEPQPVAVSNLQEPSR